jgi:hypothetical protein
MVSSLSTKLEHTDETLVGVHSKEECKGPFCTIHKRSNHALRSFPQHWRRDRGIMERTCPHGVGHPDPDEYRLTQDPTEAIHGCDGCCGGPKEEGTGNAFFEVAR